MSMKTSTRFSKKRKDLLDMLRTGVLDHPTAMEVYTHIRKTHPHISMGTVYRNLRSLSENGDIALIGNVGDCDRFDHNTSKHFHFVCSKCGKVVDVPASKDFFATLNSNKKFSVKSVKVLIDGLCSKCAKE